MALLRRPAPLAREAIPDPTAMVEPENGVEGGQFVALIVVPLKLSEKSTCARAATARPRNARNERRVRSMAGSRTVIVGEWGRWALAG